MLDAIFAVFFAPIPAFRRTPTVSRSFALSAAILLSHGEITITPLWVRFPQTVRQAPPPFRV